MWAATAIRARWSSGKGLLSELCLGTHIRKPSNHDRPLEVWGALSVSQKGGGFFAPAQRSHFACDTGVGGICVHTTWPSPPARVTATAQGSTTKACSGAWATAHQGHVPLYGR